MALYVRVRDPQTKHEFDVREDSPLLRRGVVERIKPRLYPPAKRPRPTKYHLNLAAIRPQEPAGSAGESTTTEESPS